MKTFMLHTYHAIRYGDWSCGWEYVEGRQRWGYHHNTYDGDWFALYFGNLWIEVYY